MKESPIKKVLRGIAFIVVAGILVNMIWDFVNFDGLGKLFQIVIFLLILLACIPLAQGGAEWVIPQLEKIKAVAESIIKMAIDRVVSLYNNVRNSAKLRYMLATIASIIIIMIIIVVFVVRNNGVPYEPTPNLTPVTGRIPFEGSYYQLFDTGLTWQQARTHAQSIGGDLATITSHAEQNFIEDLIIQGGKYAYWIGGTHFANGQFSWVTGESTSFDRLIDGQQYGIGVENHPGELGMIIYRHTLGAGWVQNMWDAIPKEAFDWGFHDILNLGFVVEFPQVAYVD